MATANLPALITRQGGALETVARNIEHYVDPLFPLDGKSLVAVGRLVEKMPTLNNDRHVALLVDVFAYHGIDSSSQLTAVVDTFDVEVVHLALDYLYEVGERGRGKRGSDTVRSYDEDDDTFRRRVLSEAEARWTGPQGIQAVCQLIVDIRELDVEVFSSERLSEIIHHLNGLEEATAMDERELQRALRT